MQSPSVKWATRSAPKQCMHQLRWRPRAYAWYRTNDACHVQVSMDVLHHQTLYSLNRKVNPKDVIVGWWVLTCSAHLLSTSLAAHQAVM